MKIIFLGPPGAGKGTYSSRISEILKIPHISTGDMFREAVERGSELGKSVSEYIKKGELVPDEITVEVLKNRISQEDCKKGFILDGYPRTIQQAEALQKIINIDIVFNLEIDEDVLIKKLSARRICKICGEIYNLANIREKIGDIEYDMAPMLPKTPGICDRCCGELVQRKDDQIDVIRARLKVYESQTKPLKQYYSSLGILRGVLVNAGPEVMVPKIMTNLENLYPNL